MTTSIDFSNINPVLTDSRIAQVTRISGIPADALVKLGSRSSADMMQLTVPHLHMVNFQGKENFIDLQNESVSICLNWISYLILSILRAMFCLQINIDIVLF